MTAVLSGFTIVWLIILLGYVIGRIGVVQPEARESLSRVAFFVATPCLLFITISQTELPEVVGPQMVIAALSASATLAMYMLFSFIAFKGRSTGERVMGGLSASLVNATNLGLPIAAYVLGNVAAAAPVIVFQLALYTPAYIIVLDYISHERGDSAMFQAKVTPRARRNILTTLPRSLRRSVSNPMVLSSLLGLLFSWQQWTLPGPLEATVEVTGGAAIPLLLLSFGLSLVGSKPFAAGTGRSKDVLMASLFKLIVHPTMAYICATLILDFHGHNLLSAVVMSGLPSAQNVFIAAVRYNIGETIARDVVLVTTIFAIPSIVVLVSLLSG